MGQVALISHLEHFLFFGNFSGLPNLEPLINAAVLEFVSCSISENGLRVNIIFLWSDYSGQINETHTWVDLPQAYQSLEDIYEKANIKLPDVEKRRRKIK